MEIQQKYIDRFWRKVRIGAPDECWEWQRGQSSCGYGKYHAAGMGFGAHRFAYLVTRGGIPEGMNVNHSCDNRLCVNPAHLWVGSQAENMADMDAKGRHPMLEENNPRIKLTAEQVREIRESFTTGGITQADLSLKYGVSRPCISQIVTYSRWKWLE